MKKIQAIIFDMGDILFDATQWRTKLYALLIKLDYKGSFDDMIKRWDKFLKRAHLGKIEYQTAFKGFIFSLGYANYYDSISAYSKEIGREVEKARILFPEVKETVCKLKKRGYKLAILTNSEANEKTTRERLKKLDIEEYFDVVISSIDIGYVKPHSNAFNITLKRLGVQSSDALFVGHDFNELQGALAVGIETVAFNYKKNVKATYCIDTISDLLTVIQEVITKSCR